MADDSNKPSDDAELGRPIGKDEIDPELVSLRKPALRVGPLLAVSVVVFCVFLMVQLRGDLQFSRQSAKPKIVDDVAKLAAGSPPAESYVRVPAEPDYAFSFTISESRREDGHRLVPVLGTNNQVWILFQGRANKAILPEDGVYQGRVRKLADMPFYSAIKKRISNRVVLRYVKLDALREALTKKATSIATPFGDSFAVTATTQVLVTEHHATKSVVRIWATDDYPLSYWSKELARAKVVSAKPKLVTKREYDYHVEAPAAEVQAKLTAAKLVMPEVSPLKIVHKKQWSALQGGAAGLVSGDRTVPWTSIARVSFAVKRPLPGNAVIIITDQEPGSYWYILPIMIGLALFALLFLLALGLKLRSALTNRKPSA